MVASPRLVRTSFVAGLLLAAGCQAAPRAALQTAPVAPAAATGTLRLDLAAIAAAWRPKRLLTQRAASATDVTSIRVAVRGPGMTELVSPAVAMEPDPNDGNALAFQLAVPAGRNRVFEIQGLNKDQIVRRLRGVATVEAGQGVDVTVDAQTDAVARVLDRLATKKSLDDARASQDLGPKLTAYVDRYTQRQGTANTYAGLNPVYFRDAALADLVAANGLAVLDASPNPALSQSAGSSQMVTVVTKGNVPVTGAQVELLAPYMQPALVGSAEGAYAFSQVPPGKWTIAVAYGGKTTYGELDAVDAGLTDPTTIEVPTPAPQPSASTLPFYTGSTLGPGVSAFVVGAGTLTYEDDGVEGVADRAPTLAADGTGTGGIAVQFGRSVADFSAYRFLRFQVRARNFPVPFNVRLSQNGTPFTTAVEIPASGSNTTTWSEYKLDLLTMLDSAGQLAVANGVRFYSPDDTASFRLDDIRLEAK